MRKKNGATGDTIRTLDTSSPLPLHYQLQEIIRFEALHGDLADENGKVPSENELMDRFKISRITVRHALKVLEDEGILRRERGRGTFLRSNHAENWTGQLMGFAETISAAGFKPGGKTLVHGITGRLSAHIQQQLQVRKAWQFKRLRYADDVPIAIEHSLFPEKVGAVFENYDLDTVVTYRTLESELGIVLRYGKQSIGAVNAGKEEAELLDVKEGTALLSLKRIIYTADQAPIEYLAAVYRPDYFEYTVQLQR